MFASGVDQGLIISWPRCPFLSASPYPHLHFTGYKAHKYSDTHTPGGMIQLSLQRSPPGQADLNHFTHISTCQFRYTHTHTVLIFLHFECQNMFVIFCLFCCQCKKKKNPCDYFKQLCSSDAIFRQLTVHAEYLWLELMQWTWMPAPTDDRSKANSNLWDWKINVKVPPVSTWGWSQDTILEDSYVNAQLQP